MCQWNSPILGGDTDTADGEIISPKLHNSAVEQLAPNSGALTLAPILLPFF